MTINRHLRRASEQVRAEVKDVPIPVLPSKAAGRAPLVLVGGLISVLAIVAVLGLNLFGRGFGPAVGDPDTEHVAIVRDWVEGALAGRFEEIAGLTYGESGEPEAMAQLAQALRGYQSQYGEPERTIVPSDVHGGDLAIACITLDFGELAISGGIVVRDWPDLGRKVWEFRNGMSGCGRHGSVTTTQPELAGLSDM